MSKGGYKIIDQNNIQAAFKYSGERKSHHSFNEVYFWTSVIKDWKHFRQVFFTCKSFLSLSQ